MDKTWLRIPRAGSVVWFFQRNPLYLGLLAGALTVFALLGDDLGGTSRRGAKPRQKTPPKGPEKTTVKESPSGGVQDSSATEASPSLAKDHFNRGFDCEAKRQYGKAIAEYTKAIQLDNDYALAHFSRGSLLMLGRRRADAIANFEQVITLSQSPDLTRMAKFHIASMKEGNDAA